ncbi:DUF6328 family protein [Actinoallomurus sp. CA-142502]|uniref:DUF6328 family protein n=1 Tax=Actinoallomurus sp. CA-142502 TaxID=3239885 RepID=UPI003D8C35A6
MAVEGGAKHWAGRRRTARSRTGEKEPCSCSTAVEHEHWNLQVRGETSRARLDRVYAEILQEVRIAQCGVQILLAFLLGLAFTSRFQQSGPWQHHFYVISLVSAAAALAMLIAPTSFNRLVLHRPDLRRHLVRTAHRCALIGLALVLVSVGAAVILVLSCVLDWALAGSLGAGLVVWCAFLWFVMPMANRRRHDHGEVPGAAVKS